MPTSRKNHGVRKEYRRLCRQLAAIGWICRGSAIKRSYQRPAAKGHQTYGPYYSWTRKVDNKTQTVALSLPQYRAVQSAITQHRRVERILARLRILSEQIIFATTLGVLRRKR
jgi:hypothetical protein